MEVAAGGTGERLVTGTSTTPTGRFTLVALAAVTLVLAAVCVVGGVLVVREHQDRQGQRSAQARYGDVLAAARTEVLAMLNFDYRKPQESLDAVAAGATGDFAKQYQEHAPGELDELRKNRSVMVGKIDWAGVEDVDADSATVIAATSGTVSNRATKDQPVARSFRVKVELVREGDTWKTANLEFVA
jgi:Mce-associated membrane protein